MAKNFTAISGEDWAQTVSVTNDDTGGPLTDIDTALIELQVQSDGGSVVLRADSDAGTITKPASGQFTWRFTASQMAALEEGKQYNVAARMVLEGATTMLFLTTLVVQKTGFVWK